MISPQRLAQMLEKRKSMCLNAHNNVKQYKMYFQTAKWKYKLNGSQATHKSCQTCSFWVALMALTWRLLLQTTPLRHILPNNLVFRRLKNHNNHWISSSKCYQTLSRWKNSILSHRFNHQPTCEVVRGLCIEIVHNLLIAHQFDHFPFWINQSQNNLDDPTIL